MPISITIRSILLLFTFTTTHTANALSAPTPHQQPPCRRTFISRVTTATVGAAATVALGIPPQPSVAAGVVMQNTENGIKYAVTKPADNKGSASPQTGDIVAIEYTGYLTSGQIFDSTHAPGSNKFLFFNLGSKNVIPGLNEIVSEMKVGQKVQAIIPPELAFGDKGVCNEETGDCLIKPGSTLVYDVILKKISIPPP
jgi:FKBP-type peptidyl-prolyl cis-trans isomerase